MQNFGLLFQLIVLKLETLILLIACVMREYTKMEICVLLFMSEGNIERLKSFLVEKRVTRVLQTFLIFGQYKF